MAAKPIPEGYNTISTVLAVDNATKAIEFYTRAFGAKERGRMPLPDSDKIAHAELEIGNSLIMLADPMPQSGIKPPKEVGASTVAMFVYVEDVDSVVQDAVDAGATITMPVDDQFWGDRYGKVVDPFGHEWQIATRKEEVPPEEMMERAKEAMAGTT